MTTIVHGMPQPETGHSRLATLLVAPWRVTDRSQAWLMLAIFVACVTAAMALARFTGAGWHVALGLYCAGIVFFWMFQIPHLLLVAMDARRLRAPGIAHSAAASVVLYGVLCVAVPVAVLWPLGADAGLVALAAALTVAAGLAFALSARYAMLLCYALFFAAKGALHVLHVSLPPDPSQATLVAWGVCTLLALLVLDATRWRRLARGDARHLTGMHSPMVLQLARNGARGMSAGSVAAFRDVPAWLQASADLRGANPDDPVRAIRVGLGRGIMPLTLRSHLRQTVLSLAWIALGLLVVAGTGAADGVDSMFRAGWFWLLIGGFSLVAMASGRLMIVQQRWRDSGHDLALLAMLPGLGAPAMQKRHVLRALLLQPFGILLAGLIGCAIAVAAMHAPLGIVAYAALVVMAAGGLLCVGVFGSVGGEPIGDYKLGALLVALLVLAILTPFFDRLPDFFMMQTGAGIANTTAFLAACWIAWSLLAGARLVRGWRALQARPHPFLANSR